jgi:hypothetical protein
MTKVFLSCIFILGLLGSGYAQENEEGFDQTQVITGDRTLSVRKAFKITDLPEKVEIPLKDEKLTYQIIPKRLQFNLSPEPIGPAKVKLREPLDKLYHGFVKGGAGTFATPYLEAYYTSLRERDVAYGVHLKHLSSNDGVNRPVAFSGFSENHANVWGKKIFKEHSLQSGISFQRDAYHYYGFDPQDLEFDNKDILQAYNDFAIDSKWKSYYRDSSRVNHEIDFEFYLLNDRFDAGEIGFDVDAELQSIRGDQFYTLRTGFDFVGYSSDPLESFEFMGLDTARQLPASEFNNGIFYATPSVLLSKDELRASVGLGIFGQFSNEARFHAFPMVEVSYSLFNDIFIPYASIKGSVDRNSYRILANQNPFILSNFEMRNSVTRFDVSAGIRGTLSDYLSFNAGVQFNRVDDTPLFVNDTILSAENRFQIIYDDIRTFSLIGEITYQRNEKWSASFKGQIFSYDTDVEDEAWHLPNYRFTLGGRYSLFEKFVVGADFNLIGSRMVKSYLPVSGIDPEPSGYTKIELDPYFDMSLTAEYRYTKRLSAFIEANNLTGTGYDIFYRFPAQRVFLMLGAKYSF